MQRLAGEHAHAQAEACDAVERQWFVALPGRHAVECRTVALQAAIRGVLPLACLCGPDAARARGAVNRAKQLGDLAQVAG